MSRELEDLVYKFLDYVNYETQAEYFELYEVGKNLKKSSFGAYYKNPIESHTLLASGRCLTGPERQAELRHIPHGINSAVDWIWRFFKETEDLKQGRCFVDVRFVSFDVTYMDPFDFYQYPYLRPLFGVPKTKAVVRLSLNGIEALSVEAKTIFRKFAGEHPCLKWDMFISKELQTKFFECQQSSFDFE